MSSIWLGNPPWETIETGDPDIYTLGTVVRATVPGVAVGVRYYRTGSESSYFDGGRAVGLYDATGKELAWNGSDAAEEVGSGWREVLFASPVTLAPDTDYVVAAQAQTYPAVTGYYAAGGAGEDSKESPDASLVASGGRYIPTGSLSFPTTASTACYFVDLVFLEDAPSGDAIWYVDPVDGSDAEEGSESAPFQNFEAAQDAAAPGDTVMLGDGDYGRIQITKSLTLRAINRHGPKVDAAGAGYGVQILANWVTVDGLDVTTGMDAEGVLLGSWPAHCIVLDGHHHTRVVNNRCHGALGSGISGQHGDYVYIAGNETFGCARGGWFSGITYYQAQDVTGHEDAGWIAEHGKRIVIEYNHSHDNWTVGGSTDGNGILIDDFNHTQSAPEPWTGVRYTHGFALRQNLTHGNGRKGVGVAWSNNGEVIGNTSWVDNRDETGDPGNDGAPYTWQGGISNQSGANCIFANNIGVADSGGTGSIANATGGGEYEQSAAEGFTVAGTVWKSNLFFDLNQPGGNSFRLAGDNAAGPQAGDGTVWADPLFTDPESGDFTLQAGSPAIDAGTSAYGLLATDLAGKTRVSGSSVDIGAFEFSDGAPAAPTGFGVTIL